MGTAVSVGPFGLGLRMTGGRTFDGTSTAALTLAVAVVLGVRDRHGLPQH